MKNKQIILKRMKSSKLVNMQNIETIEAGIDLIAKDVVAQKGFQYIAEFKRYAVYVPEYVQEKYSDLFPLIEDEVNTKNSKNVQRVKQLKGLSKEEINNELQKQQFFDSNPQNRIVGYARTTSPELSMGKQVKTLEGLGCGFIFKEKMIGNEFDGLQLKSLLNKVNEGDTVIVYDLSVIAKNIEEVSEILTELTQKKVILRSIKESWIESISSSPELALSIIQGLVEFNTKTNKELTLEQYVPQKRKNGKKLSSNANINTAISLYKEGKYTTTHIAEMTNISRTTLWRKLKKLGLIEQ